MPDWASLIGAVMTTTWNNGVTPCGTVFGCSCRPNQPDTFKMGLGRLPHLNRFSGNPQLTEVRTKANIFNAIIKLAVSLLVALSIISCSRLTLYSNTGETRLTLHIWSLVMGTTPPIAPLLIVILRCLSISAFHYLVGLRCVAFGSEKVAL